MVGYARQSSHLLANSLLSSPPNKVNSGKSLKTGKTVFVFSLNEFLETLVLFLSTFRNKDHAVSLALWGSL